MQTACIEQATISRTGVVGSSEADRESLLPLSNTSYAMKCGLFAELPSLSPRIFCMLNPFQLAFTRTISLERARFFNGRGVFHRE